MKHEQSPTATRVDRMGRPVEFANLLDRSWRRDLEGRPDDLAELPVPPGRRFHIWTQGCQMNDADSEDLARRLIGAGLVESERLEEADLVVLNTCVVRQASEEKLRGKMGELGPWKARRAGRTVALTGCLAAKEGQSLRQRLPGLDLVFNIREAADFVSLVQDRFQCARPTDHDFASRPGVQSLVNLIYGCNYNCTYCIVPFVRGREESRSASDVEAEVRREVALGRPEAMLLGQTVNAYAPADDPGGLAALLRRLDRVDGLRRLRFITSHPARMSDELIAAMAECDTVCEHLHLPVQSGDDEVLRRMARAYTARHYLDIVGRLRRAMPGIGLSTDIIVGFPGETEEQFERTLDLVREVEFQSVYVAAYSPRPRTASAAWVDDSSVEVKKDRVNRLLEVQRAIARRQMESLVGRTVEILVDRLDGGRILGKTRENRTVSVENSPGATPGDFIRCRVASADSARLVALPA
ncbi:MAG: tRNA (N6-isopentenyl adenosine(37)-C2)-methylthiotransferase MiaB [Candidatus Dormibacteria bacterium]